MPGEELKNFSVLCAKPFPACVRENPEKTIQSSEAWAPPQLTRPPSQSGTLANLMVVFASIKTAGKQALTHTRDFPRVIGGVPWTVLL